MTTLSISKTPYKIAYAVAGDKFGEIKAYGTIGLASGDENKRLIEWERAVQNLIDQFKPDFIVTHLLNRDRTLKKDIERVTEIRTILRLLSEKNKAFYAEFKTSGWEKRLLERTPTSLRKIKYIQNLYDNEITDVDIADAIILADGVAQQNLQIGK